MWWGGVCSLQPAQHSDHYNSRWGFPVTEQADSTFVRTFVIVMVGLTLLAVAIFAIALFASGLDKSVAAGRAEIDRERLEANLAPVATVRVREPVQAEAEPEPVAEVEESVDEEAVTDDLAAEDVVDEEAVAEEAVVEDEPVAEPEPAPAEEAELVAASDVTPGSEVNTIACAACHSIGVLNAPVTGDNEQWAGLFEERGLDELVHNAINGIRGMPPRGGNPRLTDDEIYNAVVYMLMQSDVDPGAEER